MGSSKLVSVIAGRVSLIAKLDTHMEEVIQGAGEAFVLRALGTGISLGFNVLLARLLGAEGAGVYYLALTIVGVASVIGRVGLDNSLLRFVAAEAGQEDWDAVAGVYRKGIYLAASVSVCITILIIGSASWIATHIFSEPSLTVPLQIMAVGITPLGLFTLHGELLRAIKKIVSATIVQVVSMPLVSVFLLIILAQPLGSTGATIAYVSACVLTLLLGITLWRRAMPQITRLKGHFDTHMLTTSSFPLLWVALLNLIASSSDTVLLGIWTDSSSVGVYGVALRLAMLTSFILAAVNSIVAPKFAQLYAQGDMVTLGNLVRNAAKLVTVVAAPLVLLFVTVPNWILGFFGPEFIRGSVALSILAVGQFLNVITGSVGYLLIMTGHEKLMRNTSIGMVALNVVLQILLVPRFRIVGAAIGTATTVILTNLILVGLAYWKLSIMTLPIQGAFWQPRNSK